MEFQEVELNYKFNKNQTTLTDELLQSLNKDVRSDLYEFLNTVPFLKSLISDRRKYAKDLEKDESGKIVVNITEPHILEDTDYFRPSALRFLKTGRYTDLFPNRHPKSGYARFWQEEARRCREGYIRESDGEWISGDHYAYLNFSPMMKSRKKGEKRAVRIEGFPNFYDGDYLYYHYVEQARNEGRHADVFKSRGKGFSFKGGAGLANCFINGIDEEAISKQKAFALADDREFLTKDGIINKFLDVAKFCAENTPWPRARLKADWQSMHWKMGYKDERGEECGVLNEVMGITLKNDPQKARGKRGAKLYWEENGKFRGFLDSWGIARPSVEDGSFAFGTMIAWGTGGTEGADFTGASEMFYNPIGYNVYALPNVFDKGDGSGECAFFFGEYLNRMGCYDENGNSDVIKALIELLTSRDEIRKNTSDPHALVQEKAERPITPQEGMMRRENTIFPTADLKELRANISPRLSTFVSPHYVGRLGIDNGRVTWKADTVNQPIREFPLKNDNDKHGCLEIFQMPITNSNGEIPFGRYIVGIDPIDDDHSGTNSLFSLLVMDLWTDRIVAEYTGRPRTAEEAYEIAYRTIKFYNALANYENANKGFFGFMKNKNAIHHICDTPEILKAMDYVKGGLYGNKSKGTPPSKMINAWGRRLQADWLISTPEVLNEEDRESEDIIMNMHKVRSIALIDEYIAWNIDGNFDRVSAGNMLFILREELRNRVSRGDEEDEDDLASDPYFDKVWYGKNIVHKPYKNM